MVVLTTPLYPGLYLRVLVCAVTLLPLGLLSKNYNQLLNFGLSAQQSQTMTRPTPATLSHARQQPITRKQGQIKGHDRNWHNQTKDQIRAQQTRAEGRTHTNTRNLAQQICYVHLQIRKGGVLELKGSSGRGPSPLLLWRTAVLTLPWIQITLTSWVHNRA